MYCQPLKSNWLKKIEDFVIDDSVSENTPLLKIKEYILKHQVDSLTEEYVQNTIYYIVNGSIHPFYYLAKIPLELIRSTFNEVGGEKGINFSIKIRSCIKEVLAFNELIKKQYIYKDKVPNKKQEDDFYVSFNNINFAFEVKSTLPKDYYLYYIKNYIQGKMLAHDYKKSIAIHWNTSVNQDNLPQLLSFLNTNVLIDEKTNDTVVYKDNSDISFSIEEAEEQYNCGIILLSLMTTNYTDKKINFLIIDFERKLADILLQYKNEIKQPTRKKDTFGGFIFLDIPWHWKWKPRKIKNIFDRIAKQIIEKKSVDFPIYVLMSQYDNNIIFSKFNITKNLQNINQLKLR